MGFTRKENMGIDTETYKGYAKLICDNEGNYKFLDSFDDVLQFLTQKRFEQKFNWFFNIRFDFEALIKYLDYGELVELYNESTLQYNEHFSIDYIPSKFFSINFNHKNFHFYDMHNFLEMSLNKASETFLNDKKMSDIVDSAQLNLNSDYWEQNRENIIKYCIKDAELTKRLADYFWNIIYERLNFNPKRPMSKGKLSEEYFLQICNIPTINGIDYKVLKTAYNSFYGGHFEILKRGYFDHVYTYDIKSAYPAEIAALIDYSKGKWEKVKKIDENAHSGFYSCRIEAMEEYFSPFKQKLGNEKVGLNIYPNGRFKQYLTKEEILFYESRFPNSSIKIDFGYEFTPKELAYPFKSEIERLYSWKDKETDADIKYCVKIIMNSLYGKFIQVSGKMNETGRLFNPIYAAKITAGARIKILDLALQNPDSIISFSTDSVSSTKPLKVTDNPKLGDFAKDFEGEGVFIMSDVYNLWNTETNKVKSKLRGFALAKTKDLEEKEVYLKDILSNLNSDKYEYSTNRPYHLGECLLHCKKRRVEDLNIFGEQKKTIDINGDTKRVWEKDFKTGKDCLKEAHDSLPLVI